MCPNSRQWFHSVWRKTSSYHRDRVLLQVNCVFLADFRTFSTPSLLNKLNFESPQWHKYDILPLLFCLSGLYNIFDNKFLKQDLPEIPATNFFELFLPRFVSSNVVPKRQIFFRRQKRISWRDIYYFSINPFSYYLGSS